MQGRLATSIDRFASSTNPVSASTNDWAGRLGVKPPEYAPSRYTPYGPYTAPPQPKVQAEPATLDTTHLQSPSTFETLYPPPPAPNDAMTAEGQTRAAEAVQAANRANNAGPQPIPTYPREAEVAAKLGQALAEQESVGSGYATKPAPRPPAPELRLPGTDTGTLVGRQRTAEGNTTISPIEALTRPNGGPKDINGNPITPTALRSGQARINPQALYGPPPEVPDNIKTPKKAAKSIVDDLKEKAAKEAEKAKAKKAPKKK